MPRYNPTGHPGHHHHLDESEHPMTDLPNELADAVEVDPESDLEVVPDTRGITFLRSTTTTTVDREQDGDTEVRVVHLARFAIEPGTLMDQQKEYSVWVFRPSWAEVTWRDGQLATVKVSGPRVLKNRISEVDKGEFEWKRPWHLRNDEHQPFDRDQLPGLLALAIVSYETAVALLTGGPR